MKSMIVKDDYIVVSKDGKVKNYKGEIGTVVKKDIRRIVLSIEGSEIPFLRRALKASL